MVNFTTVPTRLFAALSFSVIAAGSTAPTLQAQTTTVTFNSLTESSPGSGTRFVGNCYTESGFRFTAVGVPCTGTPSANAFVAGGPNSPVFGGGTTPSLLLNSPIATLINVNRVDGAFFSFSSIDLAPFDGARTTIVFTGMRVGGNVSRTVTLGGAQRGFMSFSFADLFTNISAVQIAATNEFGEPLVKFDNFTAMTPSLGVIPEPQTYLLMASGMFGIAVIAIRRRTRA